MLTFSEILTHSGHKVTHRVIDRTSCDDVMTSSYAIYLWNRAKRTNAPPYQVLCTNCLYRLLRPSTPYTTSHGV